MSFLDRIKNIGEKTLKASEEAKVVLKASYQEKGLEGVGNILGEATKNVMDKTKDYFNEVKDEANKASAPLDKMKNNVDKTVAKTVVSVTHVATKIGQDISDGVKSVLYSDEKNEDEKTHTTDVKPEKKVRKKKI